MLSLSTTAGPANTPNPVRRIITGVRISSARRECSACSATLEEALRVVVAVAVIKRVRIAATIGTELGSDALALSGAALLNLTAP
jgi:hypothetical protein